MTRSGPVSKLRFPRGMQFGIGCVLMLGIISVPSSAQVVLKASDDVTFKFGIQGQLWADWTQDSSGAHDVGNLHHAGRLTPPGTPARYKTSRRSQGVARLNHISRISEELVHLTGLINRPGGCATMSPSLNTVRPRNMVRTTRPRKRRPR